MNYTAILALACTLTLSSADKKQLPGQAGNDDLDLSGQLFVTPEEVKEALGADLGPGYVVVRMRAIPKTEKPLRIGPDDFTMISSKDGQKSEALDPEQIGGKGALVVTRDKGDGRHTGVSLGGLGGGVGASPGSVHETIKDAKVDENSKESPILPVLKEKAFPDKETKTPLEGLLYFPIEGKVKPKDLRILYKGPAGRLTLEFEAPKKK